jgi:hypothetical protein
MDEFADALDLCNNSSLGMNGIKFNICKALPMRAKEILLGFFNGILQTGEIPEKWKNLWEGCLYYEGKNPAPPDSYRPISLIGCDRKFMEKMLCTRLDIWGERNNVLPPTQYGFSKGTGTRDCLAILTTDINNSFEMKE